jgi:FKBP-type peptidyl-prolyl cis-trans isomerase (trigger factor)
VIRRQFGQQVHREVIGELMQSSFAEAVSQNQLAPAGNPRIEPKSIDEGQDLRTWRPSRCSPKSRCSRSSARDRR